MKKLAFLATACVLGTSACSTHVPTDIELVTLLHREGAAVDARAPLDAGAVQCLRTWSGDASLTRDLAPAVLADSAKARCRGPLDTWIADAKRNPSKLSFGDISSPDATRRAMTLLTANQSADDAARTAAASAPAAAMRAKPAPQPAPEIEATLAHATDLCEEAKSVTATDKSDVRLNRFVEYCQSAPAAATRTSVDRMKASGDNAGLDQTARRVAQTNSVVEGLLRNHKH